MNDSFIQEVDEDIKLEKSTKAIKRLLPVFVVVMLVGVVFSIYKNKEEQNALKMARIDSTAFNQFLNDQADGKSADNVLRIVERLDQSHSSFKPLVLFNKARLLTEMNKFDDAFQVYMQIRDGDYEQNYKDLATLYAGYISVSNDLLYNRISANLQKMIADKEHGYGLLATEVVSWHHIEKNNFAQARKLLTDLSVNTRTSPDIRQRVKAVLSQIKNK